VLVDYKKLCRIFARRGGFETRPIGTNLRRRVSFRVLKPKKGYPSPMTTIAELAETMQTLLTTTADALAKKQASSNGSAK